MAQQTLYDEKEILVQRGTSILFTFIQPTPENIELVKRITKKDLGVVNPDDELRICYDFDIILLERTFNQFLQLLDRCTYADTNDPCLKDIFENISNKFPPREPIQQYKRERWFRFFTRAYWKRK